MNAEVQGGRYRAFVERQVEPDGRGDA